jgi:3,4-dihydroxy 2-butanone 4-phosphate synthase / GTP cyclohydrolase II
MSSKKRLEQAIRDIKEGKMVVMVDDEDRENEGDLVYSAHFTTTQKVNFMATHAKGLICIGISKEIANRLELPLMVSQNTSSYETAFTISVDATKAKTGISAQERNEAIEIIADYNSKPSELVRPGHMFPLIAKEGGVLVRTGHTEGSTDLCKIAGLCGPSVICEIMKEDGTMARRPDLDEFCKKFGLNMVYISDIVEYRMKNESCIHLLSESVSEFMGHRAKRYDFLDHFQKHHIAYAFGPIQKKCTIKFHNIMTDYELLASYEQYTNFMQSINYLQQNGGVFIVLDNQHQDLTQIKEYGVGAQIVKYLGIEEIELLSSNIQKEFIGISGFGLSIADQIIL